MEHYFTFSNRIFCLNVCNQSLTECFDLIFDRLNFYFYLIDKLYFQYIVFSLYESFQCEQVLIHLFNCSRSEVSFNSCEMCSMLLVNSACASFCLSIDHYFKLMFPESVFSKNISKIFSSEKNRRFGLKFFYESKRIYEIIKSDGQRCIKFVVVSKQSDLTVIFCEVLVRIFCNCFYSVSLDFLLLKKQNTKGITKREGFLDACSSSIIIF